MLREPHYLLCFWSSLLREPHYLLCFKHIENPNFPQKWWKPHYLLCFRATKKTCLSKGTGSALKRRKFPKHYSTLLDPCTEQCTNSLKESQGDSKSHNKWPPYVEMHPLWDPKDPKVTLKAPKVVPRTPRVPQSDPPSAQSVPKVSQSLPKVVSSGPPRPPQTP